MERQGLPIVIKEDGLKAGKGVSVAFTMDDALQALDIAFSIEHNKVVIEEYLEGFEFSLICFVHEDLVLPMEIAQDHKTKTKDLILAAWVFIHRCAPSQKKWWMRP